jgi:hypothetical protein
MMAGWRRAAAFSPTALIGWSLILTGLVGEFVYHVVPLLASVQWPPPVVALGEFGHTVIPVGMAVVVFAILRKHQ